MTDSVLYVQYVFVNAVILVNGTFFTRAEKNIKLRVYEYCTLFDGCSSTHCTYHKLLRALRRIRYDTICYFNVRSKADMSQLNLPHGNCRTAPINSYFQFGELNERTS